MLLNKVLNILFPSQCPLCGNKSDSALYNPICSSCWRGIERYTGPACRICGIPVVSPLATICGSCMKKKPPFSRILYYGTYEGALKESIRLLKFSGVKRLSKPLSYLLSELSVSGFNGIVPVPLHPKKLRQREFNQTAVMGRHLAGRIKVPLMLDVLKKVHDTLPQTEVTGKERLENVKKAYLASEKAAGLELLLIDDVITTGATVSECARALMTAGAKGVTVAALARSMPKQNT